MHRYVIDDGAVIRSEIVVGRGLESHIVEGALAGGHGAVAVICQPSTFARAERIAGLMADVGLRATGYTLPDGEDAKQMSVVEDVYRHLNRQGFTRADLVLGVGGGSLTDVVGFVGGTYLRGIAVSYVPTTLLGAVDASIGGKTGVNVDGKNLAGVFKHPDRVVIDIDILDALPDRLKVDGAAEALKTGFISDMAIVEAYERDGIAVDLVDVVNRSVAVKVSIVGYDFREQGRRAFLNYGHTVGHAIETSTGRSHGESVAIGMVAAGGASAAHFGFSGEGRQRDVLRAVGLPTEAADAHRDVIRSLMALDKKRDRSGLRFVLLRAFGQPEVVAADDATVEAALSAVGL